MRNRSACTYYVQAGLSLIVHDCTKMNPFQVSFQTCFHYRCIDFWWGHDLRTGAEALPIYTRTEQLEKRTISSWINVLQIQLCITAFRFNGQFWKIGWQMATFHTLYTCTCLSWTEQFLLFIILSLIVWTYCLCDSLRSHQSIDIWRP